MPRFFCLRFQVKGLADDCIKPAFEGLSSEGLLMLRWLRRLTMPIKYLRRQSAKYSPWQSNSNSWSSSERAVCNQQKSSDRKPRADSALYSWQTDYLVEKTQIIVWVADSLQRWIANHLVEIMHSVIPATRKYLVNMGKWLLRYEVINHGI